MAFHVCNVALFFSLLAFYSYYFIKIYELALNWEPLNIYKNIDFACGGYKTYSTNKTHALYVLVGIKCATYRFCYHRQQFFIHDVIGDSCYQRFEKFCTVYHIPIFFVGFQNGKNQFYFFRPFSVEFKQCQYRWACNGKGM